ncbi:MAG: pyridoxamine 5'-phosphate oxidase family protein [Desulfarculus sp.]|nr:pyridoxamine 5'-phosphate oxidase family protein [Desulfarculus sp.]
MPREMRRKDRAIGPDEALRILREGVFGVLSTVSAQGQPYGAPLHYCLLDGAIYFHCAPEGRKLDNLAHDPRVSFCVVGSHQVLPEQFSTRYESVVVQGRASEAIGVEKHRALEGLIDKYSAQFRTQGLDYIAKLGHKTRVFKISLDAVSGKRRAA